MKNKDHLFQRSGPCAPQRVWSGERGTEKGLVPLFPSSLLRLAHAHSLLPPPPGKVGSAPRSSKAAFKATEDLLKSFGVTASPAVIQKHQSEPRHRTTTSRGRIL